LRLQDELAGTENRIAVERKRYNDALQDYNTYVLQFPNSLYADLRATSRTSVLSGFGSFASDAKGGLWHEAGSSGGGPGALRG